MKKFITQLCTNVSQFRSFFLHGLGRPQTPLSARHLRTSRRVEGQPHHRELTALYRGNGTMACAMPEPRVCFNRPTRSTAHASSRPSHLVQVPGSTHYRVQTSGCAWATRNCESPSACASEHPSFGLTAEFAGQKSRRMVITVLHAVAALAGIGATLWPMTSSSEPSGQWMCMLSWNPRAFFAATESGPMAPPSTHGNADNISCGTLRARTRLPRRTSTSLHWRQGQLHPRPSHESVLSTQNCPRGTTRSLQLRSKHSVRGDPVRLRFVRIWGGRLHGIPAMLGRLHS